VNEVDKAIYEKRAVENDSPLIVRLVGEHLRRAANMPEAAPDQ